LSREAFGRELLNYLIGAHAQDRWHREAQRLCGLKIDQQLLFGWRLHRQLARLFALRDGGHVIVCRHGATYPDQADTDPFNLANVDKQRQLNDAGRAKAKEIGEAFRKLKIPVGQVHTSLLYRAIETGKLMFPDITPMTTIDLVETSLISSPNENARRSAAMRKLVSTVSPPARMSSSSATARTSSTPSVRTGSISAKEKLP
jgi:Histidine phosphatase superfamily (branch 1)